LDQPVGHTSQLRLYPIRPIWSVGPGWAAVCGGLAAGGLPLSLITLLSLILVWLLADPVLGVIWDVGVGDDQSAGQRGIWPRLLRPRLPAKAPPARFLPYTQAGSPGYRLARQLGRMRHWWNETFWPEAGPEFITFVAALGLALLLGAILGRNVLILALMSIMLSWLAARSETGEQAWVSDRRIRSQKDVATLWRALGEFGIAWLIGATALGGPTWAATLLAVCYTITYFGLIHNARRFWLIGASQATVALLLAGLRHPMAAGAAAILLMPQWGLHAWADNVDSVPGDRLAASGRYLRCVQPFVIVSMILAALAVAL
jgi:hypothetical protein